MMLIKPPYGTPLDLENTLTSKTVLHIAFNEGDGDIVHDLSMHGNHGTMNDFASPSIATSGWNIGRTGVGLNFDGADDYVDCGNDESLNFGTGDFSFVFWFKTPDTGVGGRFIIQKETITGPPAPGYNAFIVGGGGLRAVVCDGTNEVDITTPLAYDDDAWHHGAVTWDSTPGTLRIYVNGAGVINGTNAAVGDIDSTHDTFIGCSATQFFGGSIDQVSIHSRVLTQNEINDYYNNPQQIYLNYDKISTRINNRYTTPYNTESESNIDKLSQLFAWHAVELDNNTDAIIAAHQLSEATGHSLDQWGNLLQVLRTVSETDDHYRARLLSYSVLYRRSATPQHMVSSCADVLAVDTSRITLSDSANPASFSMTVFLSDIEAAGLSLGEYVDIMNVAKAGGVSLSLLSEGSFECKAIAGGHDATKGYNNIADANPDGGVYAGLIGVV